MASISVKNNTVESVRKDVKKGRNIILPTKLIYEIGNPQEMTSGA